jgi:hypothetical protein
MRKLALLALFLAGVALTLTGVSLARGGDDDNDGRRFSAKLAGYEETPSISTGGRGSVELRIGASQIAFRLRYQGLEGPTTTQAHIHLGQRHTAGGVIVFFCGGAKPACPAGSADIQGTIVPSDVIGPAGQGIAAGQFDELVAAIRAGAAYANVHTTTWPAGEIRGQLRGGKDDD